MSRFLLAGGGTGGHVNPLLALGELLRDQKHEVIALGTKEGLESRLVPNRGFELVTIPRLPLPRRLSLDSFSYPFRLAAASFQVARLIRRVSNPGWSQTADSSLLPFPDFRFLEGCP